MDPLWRVAAALAWLNGVGFGIPAVYGIIKVGSGQGVPTVMGFPAYGGGPFERMGLPTTVGLLVAFLLVCIFEVAAGVLLWRGAPAGAWLGVALLLPGAFFWYGFALPFGPVFAAARTALTWRFFT